MQQTFSLTEGKPITLSEEEIHVGTYASMYHAATAEPASGNSLFRKISGKRYIAKNPSHLIALCGKSSRNITSSIEGYMRQMYDYIGGIDFEVPIGKLRPLHETYEDEFRAERTSFHAGDDASRQSKEIIAMAAEDGVYAEFYSVGVDLLRKWIEKHAQEMYRILQNHKIYNPEEGETVTKNLYATDIILHRIGGLLQLELDIGNDGFSGCRFAMIGVGLNDICNAFSSRIVDLVSRDTPDDSTFPDAKVVRRMDKYKREIKALRPTYIEAKTEVEIDFKSLMYTVPLGAYHRLRGSTVSVERSKHLPQVSLTLERDEKVEKNDIGTRSYISGYAGLVRPHSSDERYMHYYEDGDRRSSFVGISDAASTDRRFSSPLAPANKPSFVGMKVRGASISSGQIHFSNHDVFAPRDATESDEEIMKADIELSDELLSKGVQYADLFEELHEVGPVLFVDHPECSYLFIECLDEDALYEAMELVGSNELLEVSELLRLNKEAHVEYERARPPSGRWYGIVLSRPKPIIENDESIEDVPTEGSLNVDIVEDAMLEPAKWKKKIRSEFSEPSLTDFQTCLRIVQGVSEVTQDRSSGKGSHGALELSMEDETVRKTGTWTTIRKNKIYWSTIWSALKDLDIPIELFYQALDTANVLKKKGRASVPSSKN
ncbi:MAG: hypothetical protein O2904_04740 [bacterium]|nr:hypothetical protein [bacterium]